MKKSSINFLIGYVMFFPHKVLCAIMTCMGRTDIRRWSVNAKEKPSWNERNIRLVSYIEPGSSVIDIGAGAQTIRGLLSKESRYQPCDLVQSTPDTIICDFNRAVYPSVKHVFDYVVCSGVMEYIHDPSDFLRKLTLYGSTILLTYHPRTNRKGDRIDRLAAGWMNHLSTLELECLFRKSGFLFVELEIWNGHVLYRLRQNGEKPHGRANS